MGLFLKFVCRIKLRVIRESAEVFFLWRIFFLSYKIFCVTLMPNDPVQKEKGKTVSLQAKQAPRGGRGVALPCFTSALEEGRVHKTDAPALYLRDIKRVKLKFMM
jgi:hypothetical protein